MVRSALRDNKNGHGDHNERQPNGCGSGKPRSTSLSEVAVNEEKYQDEREDNCNAVIRAEPLRLSAKNSSSIARSVNSPNMDILWFLSFSMGLSSTLPS